MRRPFSVLLATALALFSAGALANSQTVKLLGHAFAPAADTLLYSERHEQTFENGRLVLHTVKYERPNGEVIAEKTATYPRQPGVAEFEFNDLRSGAREGARYIDANTLELYARKSASDDLETGTINVRGDTVVDAGFDRYVAANFQELLAGNTVKIRFGLPGRQTDYKFKVSKPEEVDFLGRRALRATISPASTILSWLVDPIKLTYDIASRRLMMYDGISNLKTDDGESQNVRIIYYPDQNPGLFNPSTPR